MLDWPDGFGERTGERAELLAALEDYRRGRTSPPLLRKWHCGLPAAAVSDDRTAAAIGAAAAKGMTTTAALGLPTKQPAQ